jgi:hypothetical protein
VSYFTLGGAFVRQFRESCQPFRPSTAKSGLPRSTDILDARGHVSNVPTSDIAQREALLSHLEHVHGKTIGVNLAIHVGPKAIHLIALDIFDGHQWSS